MNEQDRDEANKYRTLFYDPNNRLSNVERSIFIDGWLAALAHARKQTAELRAMLDELLLSVQGENIYLCDEVWAVADRIAAQLKEQDDE